MMGTIEMEMLYILATEQSHASGQASQLTTVSLRRDETRRHPNDNDARVGFADILFHLADLFVGRGAVGFNRDIGHRGEMFSTLDVVRGEAPKRLHDVKLARPRHPPSLQRKNKRQMRRKSPRTTLKNEHARFSSRHTHLM